MEKKIKNPQPLKGGKEEEKKEIKNLQPLEGSEETQGRGLIIAEVPKLTVCIPYLKSAAQGDELRYALRSLQKNMCEEFQVVIIGDREDWFSDEIIHIESVQFSKNPQIDTLEKLKLAIADERVSDHFIWSNDDIYMVSPVMLADIQILTAHGKLKRMEGSPKTYEINRNKTIDLIGRFGNGEMPIHNYDTHTPVFYDKEKLVELFEELPELSSEGLLLPSIYFNAFFWNVIPQQIDNLNGNYLLRVVSPNPDRNVFSKLVRDKKFLNNAESGYSPLLLEFLETKFSEPSCFEV